MKLAFQIFIITILMIGCELFDTRNPEDPEQARSNYQVATTPEILFENLKRSFQEKFIDIYMRSFVDSSLLNKKFVYIPSATGLSRYSILSDWDLQAERNYFTRIISIPQSDQQLTLNLFNEVKEPFGDSARYQFDYSIIIPNEDANLSEEYRGLARFIIYSDNNNQWVITEWEDIENRDFPSWSELKGRFY